MIYMTLRLIAPPERRDELVQTLRSLLARTRVAAGCLGCDLTQDLDSPDVLLYAECWETQEELDRRIRSSPFKTLIAVMEAAAKPPEIRLIWVSQVKGIDYLEEVRLYEA